MVARARWSDLRDGRLSERTQEAYLRAVRQLADHFHTRPDRRSEQQVRDYLLHLKNDRNFASASLIIACCGIKFFYDSGRMMVHVHRGKGAKDATSPRRRAH